MKKIILLILVLFAGMQVSAQNERDEVVMKAMTDEMNRTKTIKMNGMASPFFLSYYLVDTKYMSVKSVLGSIVDSRQIPQSTQIGVRSLIGNYKNSSVLDYSGKVLSGSATVDNDYLSLKTSFWELSDAIYKHSLQEIQVKQSALKQIQLPADELEMDDFAQITPLKDISTADKLKMDASKWEKLSNQLSAIFLSYPDLTDTYVMYGEIEKNLYLTTTEGTLLRQPHKYVYITAYAEMQDNNGEKLKNNYVLYGEKEEDLPTLEELEKKTHEFAKKLVALKDIESLDDYYCGPVMYVGMCVPSLFIGALATNDGGILSSKVLTNEGWWFNPIQRRYGKKVIDNKLSVSNLSNLNEYNGEALIGHYAIDADGVKPDAELVLIENGILKNMLNNRYPTTKNKKSTGSNRFNVTSNEITTSTAPGVLRIQSSNTIKLAGMKRELMKIAKADGLKYAYIVYNTAQSTPEVYRIEVNSGKQTQVKSTVFPKSDLSMLRRVPFVSKEEIVYNTMVSGGIPCSVIAPQAVILLDIEIDQRANSKTIQPIMNSPLKRK